jgi:hypothetical protein
VKWLNMPREMADVEREHGDGKDEEASAPSGMVAQMT